MLSTTTLTTPAATRRPVVTELAHLTERSARHMGTGCLVEGPTGRLVAHHLHPDNLPPQVLTALVTGDLRGLHADLQERRVTGLVPSGPVVEGFLGEQRLAFIPLRLLGETAGGAWFLVPPSGPLALEGLDGLLQRVTELLAQCTDRSDEPSLEACLEGAPDAVLPADLLGYQRFWVARLSSPVSPDALLYNLPPVRSSTFLRAVSCGSAVYLVLGGGARSTEAQALELLRSVTRDLPFAVTSGLSEVCAPDRLHSARVQADAAEREADPGQCVTVSAVRSAAVLRHLAEGLGTVPHLGRDPHRELVEHDEQRGSDLRGSVLAYLDCFGDVATASAQLNLHPNTLRYRIRKVEEITGMSLRDQPAARLELHFRLQAAR